MKKQKTAPNPTFIDLFSGCGGLSLGLSQAGWQGIFAIERATDAFETFKANFLGDRSRYRFQWPIWLEQRAHSIDEVLDDHGADLERLRGNVDLIAGGPPCQGFSFAGKRNGADPRNRMFERYVAFVGIIQPKFLVLENVPGMNVAHASRGKTGRSKVTYYTKLLEALKELGYEASGGMELDAAEFGVPQRRKRLVVVGIRSDIAQGLPTGYAGVFEKIRGVGVKQLVEYGNGNPVSAEQAISDLVVGSGQVRKQRTVEYTGFGARRGYVQVKYEGPSGTTYQSRMNEGVTPDQMDSMRLANHRKEVEAKFTKILRCRKGVNLSNEDRERLGMLKHRTVPMAPAQPAPTLTTLPDDILHYSDPRILTVRECARLQSFPDEFVFKGKYTTGGERRRVECPRYTQVGNAVPPLLARAIGAGVLESWRGVQEENASRNGKAGGRKVTLVKRSAALAGR